MNITDSSRVHAGEFQEPSLTREQMIRELTVQQDRLKVILENIPQGICFVDEEGNLAACNRTFLNLVGLAADAFEHGKPYVDVLSDSPALRDQMGSNEQPYAADYFSMVSLKTRATAEQRWFDHRVMSIVHQPLSTGGSIETFDDITESRRADARIAHVATHDALTDLPNRDLLRRQIEEALSHEIPDGCALMYIDLDRFKNVNDTLGHEIGDVLLQRVAERISQHASNCVVVARIGGDEFAVLIRQDVEHGHVSMFAERLICGLSDSYTIRGHNVVIGASIGIAIAPEDGANWAELAKHADLALYDAKSAGRGCYRFFDVAMERSVQAERALSLELQQAIGRHEFELCYQPLVNLHPQRINGFEALLRWRNPKRGIVNPGEFVPLAEELGLIAPIGEWVLRHACWRATRWPEPLRVSVNLSVAQFRANGLVDAVASALRESGLAPHRLELEITESMMLDDTQAVLSVLHRLRRMGVSIAMDDFGTGYSSLSYLKMFPFDRVKIDQSFTRGIGQRPEAEAVIWAVMGICKSLGIDSTAEGVETNAQLEFLSSAGCNEAQGYLFSRPRPEQEIERFLAAWELDESSRAALLPERDTVQGIAQEDVS
ncbi:putative bifunctional diguanylate cyclase/phosphodiesterase [Caballeronia sordidicola]|uniref:Diguanylate cyclase/phosphodiesterase (GGDEF & EAL domains) with PAS/PAC sensor(S) n=1 Tax=Caballeronia sordidicola TaxID=196367 RepID=A0A242MLB2_CABSO|nr:EAL domain-containing protein [Caballeronia sordidicola]OTP72109.1 diguanylate cyclase/phosphodiesterase (GGDEF & EAL domains) with PAS/PAC sensor(s) [Caballeronia sordidicola]